MKKLILLFILCTGAARANNITTCETIIPDRCFPEVITFEFDSSLNYTLSSYFQMKRPYCGWPPAGFTYKGKMQVSWGATSYILMEQNNQHGGFLYFKEENKIHIFISNLLNNEFICSIRSVK